VRRPKATSPARPRSVAGAKKKRPAATRTAAASRASSAAIPRQKAGRLPHEDRAAEEAERGAQADDGAKGHRRAAAQSGPDAQDDA